MYNVQEIEENINLCDGFNGRFLYDEPLERLVLFKFNECLTGAFILSIPKK